MAAEPVLYREEALALVWGVLDIVRELQEIHALLKEDDGEEEDDEEGT